MEENNVSTSAKQIIIFQVADEMLAADIETVQEVIKLSQITPVPNSRKYINGVVTIRGKVVPIMDLATVLNIESPETSNHDAHTVLLVEAPDKDLVGMTVSKVVEIKQVDSIDIKDAPRLVKSQVANEFILGVILMPDEAGKNEQVLLYVDLEAVITKSVSEALESVRTEREKDELKKEDK